MMPYHRRFQTGEHSKQPVTYLSPKFESKKSPIEGYGLFATEPVRKGEIVLDFSRSEKKIVSATESDQLFRNGFDHMYQIGDDEFVITVKGSDPKKWGHVNHSCDPNCGFVSTFTIVAMRDLDTGEEATLDYATMESSDYSFECHCGSPKCRHIVTGNDWRIPELQIKYRGYFQKYLQKKMLK